MPVMTFGINRLCIVVTVAVLVPGSRLMAQAAVSPEYQALAKEVLKKLNEDDSVAGTDGIKSYKILFDAYVDLTKPPMEVGPGFNLTTIHPKMEDWSKVSGWAESNAKMAAAVLKCKDKTINGLPYGREKLDPRWVKADVVADIGVDNSLRNNQFLYLKAVDTIAAFVTAECYRLMEASKVQEALDLAVAHMFVIRQLCDREFVAEKLHCIALLSDVMSNMRDLFYMYQDRITGDQYSKIGIQEIPFLFPDRSRLFMPEGDRVVSEALIKEVFTGRTGEADPEKFTNAFAQVQSKDAPLTRFGAAKRWMMIAAIHGSLDASLERLTLIYDDWWRRWRVDAYDSILEVPTQFDRTNAIRYAAVLYSLQDVATVFSVRDQLVAEVNGTAVAAGLCAYKKTFNTFPNDTEKVYTSYMRKRSDVDPYNKTLGPLEYEQLSSRKAIDADGNRVWVEPDEGLLWGIGQDHNDNRGDRHSDDGADGDVVLWPPIKSLQRAQGLLP
jgi:hypothetical protein